MLVFVEHLHADAFHAQQMLETIDLSDNSISSIDSGAFNGLQRLKTLRLQSNRLSTFNSDIFEGALNLHVIDLSQNFISEFPTVALKVFNSLRHLYLNGNIIKVRILIDPDPFNNP